MAKYSKTKPLHTTSDPSNTGDTVYATNAGWAVQQLNGAAEVLVAVPPRFLKQETQQSVHIDGNVEGTNALTINWDIDTGVDLTQVIAADAAARVDTVVATETEVVFDAGGLNATATDDTVTLTGAAGVDYNPLLGITSVTGATTFTNNGYGVAYQGRTSFYDTGADPYEISGIRGFAIRAHGTDHGAAFDMISFPKSNNLEGRKNILWRNVNEGTSYVNRPLLQPTPSTAVGSGPTIHVRMVSTTGNTVEFDAHTPTGTYSIGPYTFPNWASTTNSITGIANYFLNRASDRTRSPVIRKNAGAGTSVSNTGRNNISEGFKVDSISNLHFNGEIPNNAPTFLHGILNNTSFPDGRILAKTTANFNDVVEFFPSEWTIELSIPTAVAVFNSSENLANVFTIAGDSDTSASSAIQYLINNDADAEDGTVVTVTNHYPTVPTVGVGRFLNSQEVKPL